MHSITGTLPKNSFYVEMNFSGLENSSELQLTTTRQEMSKIRKLLKHRGPVFEFSSTFNFYAAYVEKYNNCRGFLRADTTPKEK